VNIATTSITYQKEGSEVILLQNEARPSNYLSTTKKIPPIQTHHYIGSSQTTLLITNAQMAATETKIQVQGTTADLPLTNRN
jgi:hypothetical protein